ncbi:hypothetical protein I302_105260 [Kwoniella bestiolae CBS 10118]|uniref:Uncharacterized protein n=1 Tax=Kwoniella bestiolae CBS 10118 TaxID=1296100 RepID=A0A1B9FSL8_9TREE|nr:hypothetical protein I302_08548 [Kwoniella bestiolae CBS 10118]OCF21769.1 hypothetical protein I302_08548 [Kwoniella bestiolae CBS 10118]
MPVTKKKGTLFAIYADTPDRPASASSSSSSLSTKANPLPKSPSKKTSSSGNGSRKALGSLQPKAIDRSISSTSSVKGKSSEASKPRSKLVYEDSSENTIKQVKSTSDIPLKSKTNQPRVKSYTSVFQDENASSSSIQLTSSRSTTKTSVGPSRKSAPTPLAPSQPIKRSRDLLSPLPITAPTTSTKTTSTTTIVRTDDPSESPAKRNRITVESTSTPVRVGRKEVIADDKENVPPPPDYSPITSDSPASRTRSKIRALTLSTSGGSPLRSRRNDTDTDRRVGRVEKLVGDGRGTLSLKKGRELSNLINDRSTEEEIRTFKPSPIKGKSTKGVEVEVEMLGDVSEAYGAERGNEPEGFKSQRVSVELVLIR